jgi:hypothetical protein
VEVAIGDQHVMVRHSDNPNGPTLRFTKEEWAAFIAGVEAGELAGEAPAGG